MGGKWAPRSSKVCRSYVKETHQDALESHRIAFDNVANILGKNTEFNTAMQKCVLCTAKSRLTMEGFNKKMEVVAKDTK